MSNQSITSILSNALSSVKSTREEAERSLEQLAINNFPGFLYNLGSELADESKDTKVRQMAATYMKNSIVYVERFREIWVSQIDPEIKEQIKMQVLATLASEHREIRSAAALVIAGICKVDLPLNEKWPGLIESLCQNAFNVNISLRLAAVESLGYVCEELSLKTINSSSIDSILSVLIQNLRDISNMDVIKTSLKAFFHTIHLAEKNFSKPVK